MPWSDWVTDIERRTIRRQPPLGGGVTQVWSKGTGEFETTGTDSVYDSIMDGFLQDYLADAQAREVPGHIGGSARALSDNAWAGGTGLRRGPWFYGPSDPHVTGRRLQVGTNIHGVSMQWWKDIKFYTPSGSGLWQIPPQTILSDWAKENLTYQVDFFSTDGNPSWEYATGFPDHPQGHLIEMIDFGIATTGMPYNSYTGPWFSAEGNHPVWEAMHLPNYNQGSIDYWMLTAEETENYWPAHQNAPLFWPTGSNSYKIHDSSNLLVEGGATGPHWNPNSPTNEWWYAENVYRYDYTFTEAEIPLLDVVSEDALRIGFYGHLVPSYLVDAQTSPTGSTTWYSLYAVPFGPELESLGMRPVLASCFSSPNADPDDYKAGGAFHWMNGWPKLWVTVLVPPYRWFIPDTPVIPPGEGQPAGRRPPLRLRQRWSQQLGDAPRVREGGNTYW